MKIVGRQWQNQTKKTEPSYKTSKLTKLINIRRHSAKIWRYQHLIEKTLFTVKLTVVKLTENYG